MSIEETISELTEQLADATRSQAARIRTRIAELESLKKERDTT